MNKIGTPWRHRSGAMLSLVGVAAVAVSCSSAMKNSPDEGTPLPPMATATLTNDPRVGLSAGMDNAAVSVSNMALVSHVNKPPQFQGEGGARGLTFANSDLAFKGNYAYQGNFSGFQIWDLTNPASPKLAGSVVCTTGQGDPSIYGNLLFVSSESTGDRTDCANTGVTDRVSKDRMVGVRIYDVSDPAHPRKVKDVQTCRGSHTHTLVPDPNDKSVVYIYISGSANVRPEEELPGCRDAADSANSSRFRVEVIKVPLAHPELAEMVSSNRIFEGLTRPGQHGLSHGDSVAAAERDALMARARASNPDSARRADSARTAQFGGRGGRGGPPGGGPAPGPNQCHDITVYPGSGYAGGACGGYGLLLDIRDPVHPKRIQAAGDTNFAFWHSATFNNDGTKIVFTDEWGGGTSPKCRKDDPIDWGGDAIFTIENGKMVQHAYYKMPAAQTSTENCVAHNGSLVPVPGRDIMVQGWYQGGVSMFDFTNPDHPYELAHFDRGPVDDKSMVTAGSWAAYWYNGHIISSEIARGLDVFDLKPSAWLSQNEIDAAKLVHWDEFNAQSQPKVTWPAAFPVVRAYLDQLDRNRGLSAARTSAIRSALSSAEQMPTQSCRDMLGKLAGEIDSDVSGAKDVAKVRMMASAVHDLARVACAAKA